MKTTLHVYYSTQKYVEGFRFYERDMSGIKDLIPMGEIEIDHQFEVPDQVIINNAKIAEIQEEIKEHKAKINLLENKVKDLLCIDSVVKG